MYIHLLLDCAIYLWWFPISRMIMNWNNNIPVKMSPGMLKVCLIGNWLCIDTDFCRCECCTKWVKTAGHHGDYNSSNIIDMIKYYKFVKNNNNDIRCRLNYFTWMSSLCCIYSDHPIQVLYSLRFVLLRHLNLPLDVRMMGEILVFA